MNTLARLREKAPLVLCITNFVTVNDCANILLAAGASPVMAQDPADAADLAAAADAVLLNTGTPTAVTVDAMRRAGRVANFRKIPLILDPVGAGAGPMRQNLMRMLLAELRFTVIRGNASEMLYLAGNAFAGRGVDAGNTPDNAALETALHTLALQKKCAVCASGAVDRITDGSTLSRVMNGHPMMARITGSGCMAGALAAAFLAADPEHPFEALRTSVLAMDIAGELAAARMLSHEGNATYRNRLIDAVSLLTDQNMEEFARYENVRY